jgi:hypothetical protein
MDHLPQYPQTITSARYLFPSCLESDKIFGYETNDFVLLESRDLTLLTRWVSAQNFRNLLPRLCQTLPAQVSQPLLKFVASSKSVGQFSQSMKATEHNHPKLNHNHKKLETLDLKTHEKFVRSFKLRLDSQAALCTSFYKSWKKDETLLLIPRLVHQQKSISVGPINYTTFDQHVGNSTILYGVEENDGSAQNVCGQISHIFTIRIPKKKDSPKGTQLWFQVDRFKNLTPSDRKKHQFDNWPYVRTNIVYDTKAKEDFIQIDAIVGHGATWKLPQGCFGIKRKTLVIVDLSKRVSNSLILVRNPLI